MSGDALAVHLRRYVANYQNVPVGHLSMLTEMTQALIAPLEIMGYRLPESMLPDISCGRLFCRWLRDTYGIDTDALPTYLHVYEDGHRVPQRPTRKACLQIFAGIFVRSGSRTAPSIIFGVVTAKRCNICRS